MKTRVCIAALACAFGGAVSGALAEDTLESVEQQLRKKWADFKSLSATMKMDMNMPGMGMKAEGPVKFLSINDKEYLRIEMNMEQSMGDQKMRMSATTLCDGRFVYQINDMMGQKSAVKQSIDALRGRPAGAKMFDNLKKSNDLTLLPGEKVDGKDAFVLQAKPKTRGTPGVTRMKVYFATDSGMTLKMVGLTDAGDVAMTVTYTDVKINPKLSPDEFTFEAPEGVTVMDMTGQSAPATPTDKP